MLEVQGPAAAACSPWQAVPLHPMDALKGTWKPAAALHFLFQGFHHNSSIAGLSHVVKIAATQAEDARRHPPPDSYSSASLSIFPQDLLIDCDERSARLGGFSSEEAREGHRALQELFGTDLKYVIHMEMTCLHFERLKLENLKLVSTQSGMGETDDAPPAQPEAHGIPVVPGPEYQHPERVAPAQQGQPAPPERPIMLAQPSSPSASPRYLLLTLFSGLRTSTTSS